VQTSRQADDRAYSGADLRTFATHDAQRRGSAAKAVGANLLYHGAAEWKRVASGSGPRPIIGKKPSAILIAPTDRSNSSSSAQIVRRVIAVNRRYLYRQRDISDGLGDVDFPISYIASDNVLGGRMAARALAKAMATKASPTSPNVKPCVSHPDRAGGFQAGDEDHPNIQVNRTQFNEDDANKAAAQLQAVYRPRAGLAGVFGPSCSPNRNGKRHKQAAILVLSRSPALTRRSRSSGLLKTAPSNSRSPSTR